MCSNQSKLINFISLLELHEKSYTFIFILSPRILTISASKELEGGVEVVTRERREESVGDGFGYDWLGRPRGVVLFLWFVVLPCARISCLSWTLVFQFELISSFFPKQRLSFNNNLNLQI